MYFSFFFFLRDDGRRQSSRVSSIRVPSLRGFSSGHSRRSAMPYLSSWEVQDGYTDADESPYKSGRMRSLGVARTLLGVRQAVSSDL